jgi:hypothetical protein
MCSYNPRTKQIILLDICQYSVKEKGVKIKGKKCLYIRFSQPFPLPLFPLTKQYWNMCLVSFANESALFVRWQCNLVSKLVF